MLRSQRFKKLSAVAGASAFVAMVLLGVGFAQNQASTGTANTGTASPGATLGETATTTTPPAEPVTSKATPPFTFTTPSGFAAPH
jgi:hypothetical protein